MEGIQIRCLKNGELRDYVLSNGGCENKTAGYLFEITLGMGKTKIKEFQSGRKEDTLMNLANYFVSNDIKVTRIKPAGSDWTVAKELINNIHHLKINKAVR